MCEMIVNEWKEKKSRRETYAKASQWPLWRWWRRCDDWVAVLDGRSFLL